MPDASLTSASWLQLLAASLFDLALALAIGCAASWLWLPTEDQTTIRARLTRTLGTCALALTLSAAAQLVLLTGSMTGDSSFASLRVNFLAVATGTHAGRALLLTLIVSCALALLCGLRPALSLRGWPALTAAVLLLLVAIRAATGHAASDGDLSLAEFMQFLHLLAIGVWAGGIISAAWLVLPHLRSAAASPALPQYSRRLSATVTLAILLILLSGLYNTDRGLNGQLAALAQSAWGRILCTKLSFVALALLLGWRNRRLLPHLEDRSDATPRFARGLQLEAILMLAILCLSAWLANTAPPTPMPM